MKLKAKSAGKATFASLNQQLANLIEEFKLSSDISQSTLDDLKYLIEDFSRQYSCNCEIDEFVPFDFFDDDDEFEY